MKAAIAYNGIEQNGKRRSLAGKVACAGFDGVKDFIARKEGVIASVYRVDEIELRVQGGDGANWISGNMDEAAIYQLDPFHRNKSNTGICERPGAAKADDEGCFTQRSSTIC